MPELPEVETLCRSLEKYLKNEIIRCFHVRQTRLRLPVPVADLKNLVGCEIRAVTRRGKYLILTTDDWDILVHLGMSGMLQMVIDEKPPGRHDHLDIVFHGGKILRYHDPRRFGLFLPVPSPAVSHPLLSHMGPEPFSPELSGHYLYRRSRNRRITIKQFLMDETIVAGLGNIYANESLFRAGIRPLKPAGRIRREEYDKIVSSVQNVLSEALESGGTTLRDFMKLNGEPGFFKPKLKVYGRRGEPCLQCGETIRVVTLGGRSTFFCSNCQK